MFTKYVFLFHIDLIVTNKIDEQRHSLRSKELVERGNKEIWPTHSIEPNIV